MAFLMLLHEKMRLQRKINKLTLKQLHMGNIQERMQRKIDKREKYYSKLEKQLERQATAYKNYATTNMNSIFTAGFDPSGIYGEAAMVGTSALQAQAMQAAMRDSGCTDEQLFRYVQGAGVTGFTKVDPNSTETDPTKIMLQSTAYSGQVSQAALSAAQQANQRFLQYQQQMTQQVNSAKLAYTEQVDQWLEIMKEQLDGQKEWEMDLLSEEQEDMEAEKTSIETQLELAKQRKEAIESELGNSVKDAAPKFGLG